ncbi:hypothetical protein CXB77_05255 [Chromatium okenii]|uniref:Signal transduction histidine kinase dimerisation/phosphoacceptor domain-containing protein n=1 Tax=Chromatium okenii TaxID=61644 RepID=A0A2S7XTY8_9GAMM|nr:hypothetical protein CXB77_05255 [Chromatium okenii]
MVWGDVRVTLIPGLDGDIALPVTMVEDITERLAAQEHNQRLQRDLDAARERATIGHLASGISHDFNNLLGVIDANLLYLSEGINRTADPEIAEVLEETQSALGHAKVITAGMLSLSRAGGIQCERVELRVVFDELIGILRHLLPRIIDAQFDVAAELTLSVTLRFYSCVAQSGAQRPRRDARRRSTQINRQRPTDCAGIATAFRYCADWRSRCHLHQRHRSRNAPGDAGTDF